MLAEVGLQDRGRDRGGVGDRGQPGLLQEALECQGGSTFVLTDVSENTLFHL